MMWVYRIALLAGMVILGQAAESEMVLLKNGKIVRWEPGSTRGLVLVDAGGTSMAYNSGSGGVQTRYETAVQESEIAARESQLPEESTAIRTLRSVIVQKERKIAQLRKDIYGTPTSPGGVVVPGPRVGDPVSRSGNSSAERERLQQQQTAARNQMATLSQELADLQPRLKDADDQRIAALRSLNAAKSDKAELPPLAGIETIIAKRNDINKELAALRKRQGELEREMVDLGKQYSMTMFRTMNIDPLVWREVEGEPDPVRKARRDQWNTYNSIMSRIKTWREDVEAGKEKELPKMIDLGYIASLHQKEKGEALLAFDKLPQ